MFFRSKIFHLLYFSLICCYGFSQSVEIIILPYPDNHLSYQDVWNFQVINSDKKIYVSLRIEIEEMKSGQMAQITTENILLNSGANIFNTASEAASRARAIYFNKNFENAFTTTQGAPSGKYKVCIYVEAKKGIEILADKCTEQEVIQCPFPILIYPSDEALLNEHNPVFSWASLNPVSENGKVDFSIHVKEILPHQSKEEAMRSNLEVFTEKNISNNLQLYPPSAKPLESGMDYCWQIRAYVSNELCAQSEVWKFEFEEPQYKKDKPKKDAKNYATLTRELNGSYFPLNEDTLRFRWDDVYNKGMMSYKIYNSANQMLPGAMPVLNRRPLDNLFSLDLSGLSLPDGFYLLEVTTEKSEQLFLKFKKMQ